MYKASFFYKYPGVKYSNIEDFTIQEGWPGLVDVNTLLQSSNEQQEFTMQEGWPGLVDTNTLLQTTSDSENFSDFPFAAYDSFLITIGSWDQARGNFNDSWGTPDGVLISGDTGSGYNPGDTILVPRGVCFIVTIYPNPGFLPANNPVTGLTKTGTLTGATIVNSNITITPNFIVDPNYVP